MGLASRGRWRHSFSLRRDGHGGDSLTAPHPKPAPVDTGWTPAAGGKQQLSRNLHLFARSRRLDVPQNLTKLSLSLQKFANVFSSMLGAESREESRKVLTRELPFEGTGSRLPVILQIEEALSQSVEIGKVIGREHLVLNNREVNLDLIELTGVNGSMHEREATIAIAQALCASHPTV